MKRYLYLILFAIALIAPFVMHRAVVRSGASTEVRAEAGAARLVIVTPHNQDIRREFARAFDSWHRQKYGRSVIVDYRIPGGTQDVSRLLRSSYDAHRDRQGVLPEDAEIGIDIAWGGGDFFFNRELKGPGLLEPMPLDPAFLRAVYPEDSIAGVRLYDATKDASGHLAPAWVGVCLSSFGIVYSPDVYRSLDLPPPTTWRDLTNEKLAGFVALADPAHSASVSVAYMMVLQRAMADEEAALLAEHPELKTLKPAELRSQPEYRNAIGRGWKRGMGDLLLIAANARYFAGSAEQPPNDVARGDAAAGLAIDFYARVTEEVVGENRARFVAPRAATAITPDPVAVLHGVKGERLSLSLHFIEFLLNPEGQRLWILKRGEPGGPLEYSLRRTPIRRDIYANQSGWTDHVNPFEESGGFNQRNEWMGLMTDTRLMWDSAWIDGREALQAAYQQIRAVSDPLRRAALLHELAMLPIEMSDVEQLQIERDQIVKAHGGVEEWQARRRIDWARRFRAHYKNVAEKTR